MRPGTGALGGSYVSDRVLALVPARGGSVGLPGKNLMHVGGFSLVARAVRVARATAQVDDVVVSSDDEAILAEGEAHGARRHVRPAHLSGNDTPTSAVVHSVIDEERPDVLVLLQPTSPLRQPADVTACLLALDGAESAVTVTPSAHPPAWCFEITGDRQLVPALGWDGIGSRRQDFPPTFQINGAVYAARLSWLQRHAGAFLAPGARGVEMPVTRSIDIDGIDDLRRAREHSEGAHGLDIVLIGASGHARAIADVVRAAGGRVHAVTGDGTTTGVLSGAQHLPDEQAAFRHARDLGLGVVIAVGDNHARRRLLRTARDCRAPLTSVIARTATVSPWAEVEPGCVVMQHAHIGPGARVRAGTIVNTSAVVEHDVELGECVHVAPHATLTGAVAVDDEAFVGAGAVVVPGVRVGARARVGAGAVVVDDVPPGSTVIGVPARTAGAR